ncbi:hypothetical protein PPACK8108_LOCUS14794 [Phakopsora pachyrhizi]|uniref:Uncharacterized protein n=1 Tax=Phakopsora pachyrhizi TaxID=170000 RepID=A0AAV0BAG4_PHAPC|nr:hypothetical protein PPACK8108_LOCUS14794 [Phakopsora pachyrhizi]
MSVPTHVLKNTYLQKVDTLFFCLMPGVLDGFYTREFWSLGGNMGWQVVNDQMVLAGYGRMLERAGGIILD